MDVQLDVVHGVYGQVVIAEQRVQAQQAHQTEVAEHLVQTALREQVILELNQKVLFVLGEMALVNAAVAEGQREGGVLEHLQLLVYVRLGNERMQHVQDAVDIPHLYVRKYKQKELYNGTNYINSEWLFNSVLITS